MNGVNHQELEFGLEIAVKPIGTHDFSGRMNMVGY
jgi:hypothetical protein